MFQGQRRKVSCINSIVSRNHFAGKVRWVIGPGQLRNDYGYEKQKKNIKKNKESRETIETIPFR